ncbi:MAG: DNA gyrase subunit A, partial [Muribaculaceae bacterium]|nr:DNA gyrase subunit A [Muribaculaceae bacterium]
TSGGVRGMKLDGGGDEVVGLVAVPDGSDPDVLVLSENGYGKRSLLDAYRVTNRGAKGVRTMKVTEKTGSMVALKIVDDDKDLVIINRSGITLRIRCADLRVIGRVAQGVRLINLEKRADTIASVCCVDTDPEEETEDVAITEADILPEETGDEFIEDADEIVADEDADDLGDQE